MQDQKSAAQVPASREPGTSTKDGQGYQAPGGLTKSTEATKGSTTLHGRCKIPSCSCKSCELYENTVMDGSESVENDWEELENPAENVASVDDGELCL